jgi:ubiquinone/menaquinone biosynthesis C-methylase UbiE
MIKIVTVAQKRVATNISPQMLSISKQRAISLDLSDMVEIKVGDTETIDLPISIFDSALCRAGLMLLPDLKAGLLNIYWSLIEGGRFAASV